MKNQNIIQNWIENISAQTGAAQNTLQAYQNDIQNFAQILKENGNKQLVNATSDDIHKFLIHITQKGLRASSQARKLSAIRQFYKFLFQEGIKDDEPTQILKAPKTKRALPKIMSEKETEILLKTAYEEVKKNEDKNIAKKRKANRMYAMLEILYATGLRVSELIKLPIEAGKLKTDCLIVKGKGNKERMVPIGKKAKMALKPYMEIIGGQKNNKFLFPSNNQSGHITRQHFARELKELAKKAGLDETRISPHVIRHAFASHLLQNGADLRILQQLLGHADIATTQIYTHIMENQLHELMAKHPIAQ